MVTRVHKSMDTSDARLPFRTLALRVGTSWHVRTLGYIGYSKILVPEYLDTVSRYVTIVHVDFYYHMTDLVSALIFS